MSLSVFKGGRVMLVEERVSEFERAMMQLVYQSRQTEISIFQLSEEMRNFKDEMTASKNEMNRKWGDLVRKMGTFVEDIALPGLPLLLKKSFGLDVDDMSIPKGFRLWLSAKYRRGARLRRYRWRFDL